MKVYAIDKQTINRGWLEDVMMTMVSNGNGTVHGVCYKRPEIQIHQKVEQMDITKTYDCRGNGNGNTVCNLTGDHMNRVTDYTPIVVKAYCAGNGQLHQMAMLEVTNTLDCMHDQQMIVIAGDKMEQKQERKYVLRRLTPLECLRLQGLPDWWVDGANGSDSAIYRMAGNGLAIPCAADVLGRIAKELNNNVKD